MSIVDVRKGPSGPSIARWITSPGVPGVSDDSSKNFPVFSKWIDTSTNDIYESVDSTPGAAIWSKLSGAFPGYGAGIVWGDPIWRLSVTNGNLYLEASKAISGNSPKITLTDAAYELWAPLVTLKDKPLSPKHVSALMPMMIIVLGATHIDREGD